MPTIRQRKLATNLGKSRSIKEAMVKSGYTESYAEAGQIQHTKSFPELLEEVVPLKEAMEVHREQLHATKIHTSHTEPDREVPDNQARLKAVELKYRGGKHLDEKPPSVVIGISLLGGIAKNGLDDSNKEISQTAEEN